MLPPSGNQYRIAADGYAAVITESGAALRELTFEGRPLIDGFAESEMASGGRGQILMPWPNRIRDGRYSFAGKEQQLALTEPKRHNASHGLVRWAAWSVIDVEPDRVWLEYRLPAQTGYPWSLNLQVSYTLVDGLYVTQSASNMSDVAVPYASGAHPYLVADASGRCDGWTMTCPAQTRLLTDDERLLPTVREALAGTTRDFREPRLLGDVVLNDAVTDLGADAKVRLTDANGSGAELWVDDHHKWLQLYTGDDTSTPRRSIAIEPMTAPPDAFNSGDDLVVIEPGDTFAASWGIRALA